MDSVGGHTAHVTAQQFPFSELVSGVVLESPQLVVLGDFNIYAEAGLSGAAHVLHDNHGAILPNAICSHSHYRTHYRPGFLYWGL